MLDWCFRFLYIGSMKKFFTYVVEFKKILLIFVDCKTHDDVLDDKRYSQMRGFLIKNFPKNYPSFFKSCRTISDFIDLLMRVAYGTGSRQARRNFINSEFENFLNFLEFWENWETSNYNESSFTNDTINITLQKKIFDHVKTLLESKHYFNAVEESYKIVREKLRSITGEEQAHKGFKEDNYEILFWHKPENDAEKGFFEGVRFLHMAIQNLRNEKSHTPAKEIDKNLAIHYIVLASLAYDLINNNSNDSDEIDKFIETNKDYVKERVYHEIMKEAYDEERWNAQYEQMRDEWLI